MVRRGRTSVPEPVGPGPFEDETEPVFKKQVSVFLPLSDHVLLRDESIRSETSIAQLVRRWLEPHLQELRDKRRDGS